MFLVPGAPGKDLFLSCWYVCTGSTGLREEPWSPDAPLYFLPLEDGSGLLGHGDRRFAAGRSIQETYLHDLSQTGRPVIPWPQVEKEPPLGACPPGHAVTPAGNPVYAFHKDGSWNFLQQPPLPHPPREGWLGDSPQVRI